MLIAALVVLVIVAAAYYMLKAPASGTPASGTPASGTPASGTPASGTPASGTPASSTPASGITGYTSHDATNMWVIDTNNETTCTGTDFSGYCMFKGDDRVKKAVNACDAMAECNGIIVNTWGGSTPVAVVTKHDPVSNKSYGAGLYYQKN